MKNLLSFLFLVFLTNRLVAQITFQKQFRQPDSASSFQTYDAKITPDGGYILAGLASEGTSTTFHPFLLKLNCKSEIQWYKLFGNTQTTANVFHRVIVTHDSNFVLMSNLGVYSNYNGLVAKVDGNGNILWEKILNLSNGSDQLTDIKETNSGQFVLTGSIKSTPDVGLIKLNSDGTLVWNKTFGNANQYDEGSAITILNDGSYLVTGRYISMGTFNAFLLKTDTSGAMQWLKCYGDTLQHMWGFDVKELGNGDLILAGSTTLLKPNYQSYTDNYVMRLNSVGDTVWTKIFYGTPDLFENVSSILIDAQENIILGVATASYVTPGFVPNKNAIMKFSPSGNLLAAKIYNNGSSHYTRINPSHDDGVILSGYSTMYAGPVGFQTLFMKMNQALNTGCFDTDVTALTVVTSNSFKVTQPLPLLGTSGTSLANSTVFNTVVVDSVLCQAFPLLLADFEYSDTCLGLNTHFVADTSGVSSWHWDFGLSGNSDTSTLSNPIFNYNTSGSYDVTLIVGNGCEYDTLVKTIQIIDPQQLVNLGPDTIKCRDSILTIGINNLASSYLWNTGDTTSTIQIQQPGMYILSATFAPCGVFTDTIVVGDKDCFPNSLPPEVELNNCSVFIPNVFSPNGDGLNDVFRPTFQHQWNNIDFVHIEIFNRWGCRVFVSQQVNEAWDGMLKGVSQDIGTYHYMIRYRCSGSIRIAKGEVVLVR